MRKTQNLWTWEDGGAHLDVRHLRAGIEPEMATFSRHHGHGCETRGTWCPPTFFFWWAPRPLSQPRSCGVVVEVALHIVLIMIISFRSLFSSVSFSMFQRELCHEFVSTHLRGKFRTGCALWILWQHVLNLPSEGLFLATLTSGLRRCEMKAKLS